MAEIAKNLVLSESTKLKLDSITTSSIQTYAEIVDYSYAWVKRIDNISKIIESNTGKDTPKELDPLRRLCEYSILVGLIWLDITTAFRIYINAKQKYEVTYCAKQLVITINEGYKKIYNFVKLDKNGKENLQNRKNSFWVKDIGELIYKRLPNFLLEYKTLTNKLDLYFEQNFESIKVQRNLAVHYDENPSKVYAMLIGLNIEDIAIKTIPFMNILSETLVFYKSILIEYNRITTQKSNDLFTEQLQNFENLKTKCNNNPEAIKLLNDCQENWIEINKKFRK
jgi:hypothetical protein